MVQRWRSWLTDVVENALRRLRPGGKAPDNLPVTSAIGVQKQTFKRSGFG
jgi:hypothetical protein